MSLIHEALKKAQVEAKAQLGSGLVSFQEPPPGREKEPMNKRTIVLAGILVAALIFLVYTKFFGTKRDAAGTSATPAPAVNLELLSETDVVKLKKRALDAYGAGDMDSAFATLTTAADLDKNDPEIWNNLGLVARKQGDAAKAREYYQKALELKQDYPEAMNNMAVLEMQSGNTAEAKSLLERAVKISPAYPEANLHLAILCDEDGDTHKAAEYYKRFLEVGKKFPSMVVDSVRDRVMEITP